MIRKKNIISGKPGIILSVFLAGMFLVFGTALSAAAYSDGIQEEIASGVIRLHVLANSDTPEDQAVKFMVRDAVLEELRHRIGGVSDIDEAKNILAECLADIEQTAGEITDYPVTAALTRDYFPTRTYNDVTLPAGVYETLRVSVGAAAGRNWWCVMFPPLCLSYAEVEQSSFKGETDDLKNILSVESYDIVTKTETTVIKFKVVEIWQEIKHFFGIKG